MGGNQRYRTLWGERAKEVYCLEDQAASGFLAGIGWWAGEDLNLRPPLDLSSDALSLSYLPVVGGARRDPDS